tara:strand:+ start:256 stop:591 length:336 start_codon:yes stop_codon:yes gene_type:complete
MTKVMAVDDDAFARMLCAKMLYEIGYEVIEASNGPGGIEKYEATRSDAVLLYITMPDMDGIETMGKLLEMDSAAKLIIVTDVEQRKEVVKALRCPQRLGTALNGIIDGRTC